MPQIPLYGYIPDPVNDQALYVLKEEQVTPTQFQYTGRIGFGTFSDESGNYVSIDMQDIQFTYNSVTNTVRLECYCRGSVYAEEAKRILPIHMEMPTTEEVYVVLQRKNTEVSKEYVETVVKELEEYRDSSWENCYLYFRCPRSKDGIAVSRAIHHMFDGRPIKIIYPLIYNLY